MDSDPHGSRQTADRTAIPAPQRRDLDLRADMITIIDDRTGPSDNDEDNAAQLGGGLRKRSAPLYMGSEVGGELAVLDELGEYDREACQKGYGFELRGRGKTHPHFTTAQKCAAQSLISASDSYLRTLSRRERIQAKELLQKMSDALWDYQDRPMPRFVFNQCERVIEKLAIKAAAGPSTETPASLRNRINEALDVAIGAQPISDRDRDHLERDLLDYWTQHGHIPNFSIAKVSD
jgi:hypothetical protein